MHDLWKQTPPELSLSAETVDIWKIDLKLGNDHIFAHSKILSRAELDRADKYVSGKKSREFIITRSSLRIILGHVLGRHPGTLEFDYTRHGMPYLVPGTGSPDVRFSVSHSHDLALIAVTLDQPIGVDIEKVREEIDYESLARRFFSEQEHRAIMDYEGKGKPRAFFATWTRKEAIVKATGNGIASGLKQFDVSVDPDQPARLLATRWEKEIQSSWSLTNIEAGPDYMACLAMDGSSRPVQYWYI
jgi:4'-phosphopantetheinyl transferase